MKSLLKVKNKPLLIGEVSCNHNGNIKNAKKIIDVAKKMELILSNFKLMTHHL